MLRIRRRPSTPYKISIRCPVTVFRTVKVLPTISCLSCASSNATAPLCCRSATVVPGLADLRASSLGEYQIGEVHARSCTVAGRCSAEERRASSRRTLSSAVWGSAARVRSRTRAWLGSNSGSVHTVFSSTAPIALVYVAVFTSTVFPTRGSSALPWRTSASDTRVALVALRFDHATS